MASITGWKVPIVAAVWTVTPFLIAYISTSWKEMKVRLATCRHACLSCLYRDRTGSTIYSLSSFQLCHQHTSLKTLTRSRTDRTDDFVIPGPATSFCSYSKIVSGNVSQRCPGRSGAHATGRGPCTGPTRLISRLRWWDWHSRVTK